MICSAGTGVVTKVDALDGRRDPRLGPVSGKRDANGDEPGTYAFIAPNEGPVGDRPAEVDDPGRYRGEDKDLLRWHDSSEESEDGTPGVADQDGPLPGGAGVIVGDADAERAHACWGGYGDSRGGECASPAPPVRRRRCGERKRCPDRWGRGPGRRNIELTFAMTPQCC